MSPETRKFLERSFQSVLVGLIGGATAGTSQVVVRAVVIERRNEPNEPRPHIEPPPQPLPVQDWQKNGVIRRRPLRIGETFED